MRMIGMQTIIIAITAIYIVYVIFVAMFFRNRKRFNSKVFIVIAIFLILVPFVVTILALAFWPDLQYLINFH